MAASALAGFAFSATAAMPFLPLPALFDVIVAPLPSPAIPASTRHGWQSLSGEALFPDLIYTPY
jgi:hypothetical protein